VLIEVLPFGFDYLLTPSTFYRRVRVMKSKKSKDSVCCWKSYIREYGNVVCSDQQICSFFLVENREIGGKE